LDRQHTEIAAAQVSVPELGPRRTPSHRAAGTTPTCTVERQQARAGVRGTSAAHGEVRGHRPVRVPARYRGCPDRAIASRLAAARWAARSSKRYGTALATATSGRRDAPVAAASPRDWARRVAAEHVCSVRSRLGMAGEDKQAEYLSRHPHLLPLVNRIGRGITQMCGASRNRPGASCSTGRGGAFPSPEPPLQSPRRLGAREGAVVSW
jgi:hypothetical protein